ncbi:MAG: dihydroneopterin aldolase [SAR202 cluster bacterium]|nr:dihydroneopterin aldolase [SAR202 cluster bacterium]|tara:strand:+ start:16282 stop:16650 length:369 start_codon:yes stop_codon:yes gene_type:complete
MDDSIKLSNIKLYGYHGVNDFERENGQYFLINLEFFTDLKKAGLSDSLKDTVDYSKVYESIKNIVEGPSIRLLEKLAAVMVDKIFETFPQVSELNLEIEKPRPPIEGSCIDGVSVRINRSKA